MAVRGAFAFRSVGAQDGGWEGSICILTCRSTERAISIENCRDTWLTRSNGRRQQGGRRLDRYIGVVILAARCYTVSKYFFIPMKSLKEHVHTEMS